MCIISMTVYIHLPWLGRQYDFSQLYKYAYWPCYITRWWRQRVTKGFNVWSGFLVNELVHEQFTTRPFVKAVKIIQRNVSVWFKFNTNKLERGISRCLKQAVKVQSACFQFLSRNSMTLDLYFYWRNV